MALLATNKMDMRVEPITDSERAIARVIAHRYGDGGVYIPLQFVGMNRATRLGRLKSKNGAQWRSSLQSQTGSSVKTGLLRVKGGACWQESIFSYLRG